jgi:hypothetical protein
MIPLATSPSEPPDSLPVVRYCRDLVVAGQPAHACVINLTAAFLEQLFGEDDLEPEPDLAA